MIAIAILYVFGHFVHELQYRFAGVISKRLSPALILRARSVRLSCGAGDEINEYVIHVRAIFYSVSATPSLTGLSSAFQTSTHGPALSCKHPALLLPRCCAHSSVGILLLLPSFSPFRFVCAFIIYLIGNDSHRRHTVSLARASACRSRPGDGSVRSG